MRETLADILEDDMNKRNIILFLIGITLMISLKVHSQSKIIVSKANGKTLSINSGNFIGLITKQDTIRYKENGNLSYELYKISSDTLVLRKPAVIRDSIIDFTGKSNSNLKPNWVFLENISGKSLFKIAIVESYKYKNIAISEIKSLQFPPKIDQKRVGCIFCIFIPVYNLFYIVENNKYDIPKTFSMKKWNITIAH